MQANDKMSMIANIPQELRELDQWVIWKADKQPRNARNGKPASVSDPSTWSPFDIARKNARKFGCLGVGFVFTKDDPYAAIDLDKVIDEDGEIDPKSQEIIDRLDSYTEISQSGRGIHIIVRGEKPGAKCRKENTEIYDHNRYFALTGNVLQDRKEIEDRQEELGWLCGETFGSSKEDGQDAADLKLDADAEPPQDKMEKLLDKPEFRKVWGKEVALKSLSDYDWQLASIACKNGWKDQEIANLIIAFRRTHGEKDADRKKALRADYIARTIKRARQGMPSYKAPDKIRATDLMNEDLADLRFALPDILPEGLTILAGKPKSGKSWWALQAAYSVALGKNLMDGTPCEHGEALVLALEDGKRRLQDRVAQLNGSLFHLIELTKTERGNFHIKAETGEDVPYGLVLSTEWPRLGEGCIEELEKHLDEYPNTRLIVIDIIKRITKKKGKGAAYDEDYESIQPLQELAIKRGVAILGVHHTRKAVSDDPFDTVSGTFGLTGGADSILILKRENDNEFRLSVTGRDIKPKELAVELTDGCIWKLLGDADEYFLSGERKNILEAISETPMTPKQISESTGASGVSVRQLLWKMSRDGLVKKDGKGLYSVTPAGGAATILTKQR